MPLAATLADGRRCLVRVAAWDELALVHAVMLRAFAEYRGDAVPSSALSESLATLQALVANSSWTAIVGFVAGVAQGCARFRQDGDRLQFARVSVVPEARRRGLARCLLAWLDAYALRQGMVTLWCRVRLSMPGNVRLYETEGYTAGEPEVVDNPNGFPVETVVMTRAVRSTGSPPRGGTARPVPGA